MSLQLYIVYTVQSYFCLYVVILFFCFVHSSKDETTMHMNHLHKDSCQESMLKVAQCSVLDFELTSLLGGPGILD